MKKKPRMDTNKHELGETTEHTENTEERRLTTKDELTDFLLYTAPDGQVKVECILHDETLWLTQDRIAELFGVQRPAITKHLKNGRFFGKDYFRELLERVRSIRASERRIYQQITDIFAECSIDYDPQSETTRNFYAMFRINSTLLLPAIRRQRLSI